MEQTDSIKYPTEFAARGEQKDEYPTAGGNYTAVVHDPYRFLEDPDSEPTKAWVTEQNKVCQKYLEAIPMRGPMKEKMTELWNYAKTGCLNKHGDHYYFTHNTGLQNQYVHYKITEKNSYKLNPDNACEGAVVFIDPNSMSEDGTTTVGSKAWSDDGAHLAYQINAAGSDWATIKVRNAETCKDLEHDELKWIKFSGMSWTKDNQGFFYSAFDAPKTQEKDKMDKAGTETEKLKNQKVYYHRVGTKQSDDVCVYKDDSQPEWMFDAEVTNDGKTLLICSAKDCDRINLISYVDLTKDENKDLKGLLQPTPIVTDWIGEFSYLQNHGTQFYFTTNYQAPKSKIIKIDFASPDKANWVDVVTENKNSVLDCARCCNNLIICCYIENASEKMKVFKFDQAGDAKDIKFPDIGSIMAWSGKHDSNEMFYKFSSFSDPGSMYRVDLDSFESQTIMTTKLSANSPDITNFKTDQVWYTSKDGTKIPMFMVRKKSVLDSPDTKPAKPIPTILYGYGGFNISITPYFSPARLVFMNNLDSMFCVANIRGGGEFGEEWHHAGQKGNKQNVFDDFCAAAEFLHEKGYTDPAHTAILGGSNGGTLVSACANQRPDLFACGVPMVPVTDMLRFQKFTIGHFWCSDFGDSEKDGGFDYLIKYSPLHNVKAQKYPALMTTTADHDDRVVPLHSFKYVATLQHVAGEVADQNPLFIRIDINAGHGAGMPTHMIIQEMVDIYGFVGKFTGAEWKD